MSSQQQDKQTGNMWLVGLAFSLLLNFGLGLSTVWVNTQRTNIGYELKRAQLRLSEFSSHSSKLEVERDKLLSPYYLERKARELGMRNAQPGQIRRLQQ
jgi:hypothetical protein